MLPARFSPGAVGVGERVRSDFAGFEQSGGQVGRLGRYRLSNLCIDSIGQYLAGFGGAGFAGSGGVRRIAAKSARGIAEALLAAFFVPGPRPALGLRRSPAALAPFDAIPEL
jgi:hypothetical protein